MSEAIKCPNCGKKEITITGTFKIYYHWLQAEEDKHSPCFFDYELGDYEPIDGYPLEFICHSCNHVWEGDNDKDYFTD
jgi:hypothetical protein